MLDAFEMVAPDIHTLINELLNNETQGANIILAWQSLVNAAFETVKIKLGEVS